ncbi:hypothetical protein AMCSP13_002318 [Streptococcus pneumoniae 2070335]|nr:hypothetical protein SPAR26_0432 [Streptococcus pneumoniae GA13224]EJG42435.1 hypothetical protein AMCSP13_002318 [Streptococcus pneumoniae 2070335]
MAFSLISSTILYSEDGKIKNKKQTDPLFFQFHLLHQSR